MPQYTVVAGPRANTPPRCDVQAGLQTQFRGHNLKLTIRKVGNSLGLTLPAEAAKALRVKEGDALYLTETPEGYQIVAHDPDFEKTMKAAEGFMSRYRNTLRELAK